MLANIIEWSGRNRFLVLLATLFITIAGIYAVLRTPIDALPDLSDVQVIVYTEYPGQSQPARSARPLAAKRGGDASLIASRLATFCQDRAG